MATIYLSTLDSSLNFPTKALFDGSKVPLPVTSVPFVTGAQAGKIIRSAFSNALKFATTHTSGTPTNTPESITANGSDITAIAKSIMPVNTIGKDRNMNTSSSSTLNFLGQLSKEIFGSEHSADLFNNQAILATNYITSVQQLDRTAEVSVNTNVATQVVNALMLEKSERFGLKYSSSISPANSATAGEHRGVVFTGTTTGVAKTVTVENTTSAVTRMTKESEGHFVPGVNAYALAAVNGAGPANLGRLHNDISLTTTGSGLGATVNIAANGITNGNITAITVVSSGSGYAADDTVTIAAGALGTGSGEITFKLLSTMLSGSSLINHSDLLKAVNEVYIAVPNLSAKTITPTQTGNGSGLVFTVINAGTTNSTISAVEVTNAGNNYSPDDVLTIPAGVINGFGAGSQAFTITVTAAMLSSGTFPIGSHTTLLAALQAAKGTIAIVNPNSFTGVALKSGAMYNTSQTVTFNATVDNNPTVTAVNFTNAGTRMKVGDTLTLAANVLGTSSATTITLTENMISDYGTLLSANADMIAAFPTGTAGSYNNISGTIARVNTSRKVGKNAVATINVTDATTVGSINFTNHGSGYRPGDSVIIPATTLGPASPAITFVVTEQMLLESGGILTKLAAPNQMTLPDLATNGVTNPTGRTSNLNLTVSLGSGYTTNGAGTGAQFIVTTGASSPAITSIKVSEVGKGFKVGDTITFLSSSIGGSNDYVYTIPDGIINQRFAMGEIITSTAGAGSGVGGIGGTAVITISGNTKIGGAGGINSIQRATLNESLSSPTEVPLEVDDKIQILYTINSNSNQQNSADESITIVYEAIFEFEIAE